MYYVKKKLEVSASHKLELNYQSKCNQSHGHNWDIRVFCKSRELDHYGMVVDFGNIKKQISDRMDHKNLNEQFNFNPTAENIARWIVNTIPHCYKCSVKESKNNVAIYEKN